VIAQARAALVRPLLVVGASVSLLLVVYAVLGYDVGTVVGGIVDGSVGSGVAVRQTVRWSVPLLVIAIGVAVTFRAGYFNVGAQGQMYVGAIAGLAVGLAGRGTAPWLVVPLAMVAAVGAGALYALLPGLLRLRFGADEVVTTLMLNFVAVLLLEWVCSGPLKSEAGTGLAATTVPLDRAYRISSSEGVSPTVLGVCAVLVVVAWLFLHRTRTGLESSLVGRNPVMARWQGIRSGRLGLLVFAIAGGCAGLAGALEAFGPAGALRADFSAQVGFMAVVVALVGGLGVLGIVAAALFFGALRAATLYLPVVSDVPQSGIEMFSGFVALFITATAVPALWARRRHRAGPAAAPAVEEPVHRKAAEHA
jgi:simple sugar transport system permease protein